MNIRTIKKLQKQHGLDQLQDWINSGTAWLLEGSIGRQASQCLEQGSCMLPKSQHSDYWGSTVPSRDNLKPGSKGTYQNCVRFWTKFVSGELED